MYSSTSKKFRQLIKVRRVNGPINHYGSIYFTKIFENPPFLIIKPPVKIIMQHTIQKNRHHVPIHITSTSRTRKKIVN